MKNVKIECRMSKKNTLYYVLTINGEFVTFDVNVMSKAFKVSMRDIYLLEEGEYITLDERS